MNYIHLKLLCFTIFIIIDTSVSNDEESKCSRRFQKKMIDLHNLWRPRHSAPILKQNKQLSNFAKLWTTELAMRNKGLARSEQMDENMGENLAGIFGGTDTTRCRSNVVFAIF